MIIPKLYHEDMTLVSGIYILNKRSIYFVSWIFNKIVNIHAKFDNQLFNLNLQSETWQTLLIGPFHIRFSSLLNAKGKTLVPMALKEALKNSHYGFLTKWTWLLADFYQLFIFIFLINLCTWQPTKARPITKMKRQPDACHHNLT